MITTRNILVRLILVLLLVVSVNISGYCQIEFIENKGQWHPNVQFKTEIPGGNLFLEKNVLTYDFVKEEDVKISRGHHRYSGPEITPDHIIHYHAYKVKFVGSNPDVNIVSEEPNEDYNNYFVGNDPSGWATKVKKYNKVSYPMIYNYMDLIFYIRERQIKYDFVVKPGGDPHQISMEFDGQDNIQLTPEGLKISTSVNEVLESKPYAYQIKKGKRVSIPCNYVLKDNNVTFELGKYDPSLELIIDPLLIFSTYTGSTQDNWGFTATYDLYGNVFSGGIAQGVGYPVSPGAYQTSYGGSNWDVAIIKYNETGSTRLYATFLGGLGCEMPHSMVINSANQLLIFGTTGSSNFPVTSDSYDPTFNGGTNTIYDNTITFPNGIDIFVTKLSENGDDLLAGTYVGGSKNDGLNYKPYINWNTQVLMKGNDSLYYNYADGARGEIIVDAKSYVYVGSCTFSNDFPTTFSSFQTTYLGKEEGVVFKMDPSLSTMEWCSYLGGSEDDAIYSIETDNNGDVYVAGGTVSSNFPTTPAAFQQFYNGGTDGFVTQIDMSGTTIINSTYFGTPAYDQVYFVRNDKFNNVFVTGQTKTNGSQFIYNATYGISAGGQFITKFKSDLQSQEWSTMFGVSNGKPDISITAFTVDVCNRVYLAGWGREWPYSFLGQSWSSISGTKNMYVTTDAEYSVTDGQDFYIMVLRDDASGIDYATYYGEPNATGCGTDHVDGGTSRFDKKGHIYQAVCASCGYGCSEFPTTPGAWGENSGALLNPNEWVCNNAVFSFSFADDFCVAEFVLPTGCNNGQVSFTNTSVGTNYFWDFGDSSTSAAFQPTHIFEQSGTYTITLIVSDPSSCNLADTISQEFVVVSNVVDTLESISICENESTQIGMAQSNDPDVLYSWYPSTGLSNSAIANPVATVTSTTTYLLVVSKNNGACVDSLYQTVNVFYPVINATALPDTTVCKGSVVTLQAFGDDLVETYIWSNSTNFSNPLNTNLQSGDYTLTIQNAGTYYVQVNGANCNASDMDSVTVGIYLVGLVTSNDTTLCLGDTISLVSQPAISGDVMLYLWSGIGIIGSNQQSSILISPTQSGIYTINATNQHNCPVSDQVDVDVDVLEANLIKTDISCNGLCNGYITYTVQSGQSPYIYQWNTGSSSSALNSLCSGNYSSTITDLWGCTITDNTTVIEPSLLAASISNIVQSNCDETCAGAALVTASGGIQPYTYLWSDSQTDSNATLLCTGLHFVTVSDANNCDTILNVVIVDPSNLEMVLSPATPLRCYGDCNGVASCAASLGAPPYNYIWSIGATGQTVTNLCAGNHFAKVIDSIGCSRTKFFLVTQPPQISANISTNDIVCNGDSAYLSVQAQGGTGSLSFNWYDSQNELISQSSVVNGLYEGTYYVSVSDENDCWIESQMTLIDPPVLVVDSIIRPLDCAEACNGFVHLSTSGGIPPYNFQWSNVFSDSVNSQLCSGYYDATVTDNRGCSKELSFFVGIRDYIPYLNIYADTNEIYPTQSTGLHATQGYPHYYWSPTGSLQNSQSSNPVASPDKTTLYYLSIADSAGCLNKDSILIIVNDVNCREPYIYIPNAFTPNGDGLNDDARVYSNVIDELYFAIFDRWGELVFETEDINQGWNGIFRNVESDPAVFVYYMKATCIDKRKFEKKGNITLIR